MRIVLRLMFAAALTSAALPVTARQSDDAGSLEAAIARVLANTLPTERRPRARNWSDFDRRNSADLVLSVLPPNDSAGAPQECEDRRTGWVAAGGASAEILACGDIQQIDAISVEVSGLWLGRTDVIAELEARGVTAVLEHSIDATPPSGVSRDTRSNRHYRSFLSQYPASRRWRLERDEEEPATLTAEWRCTPPGTRSATRCSMTWTLVFASGEPPASDHN